MYHSNNKSVFQRSSILTYTWKFLISNLFVILCWVWSIAHVVELVWSVLCMDSDPQKIRTPQKISMYTVFSK